MKRCVSERLAEQRQQPRRELLGEARARRRVRGERLDERQRLLEVRLVVLARELEERVRPQAQVAARGHRERGELLQQALAQARLAWRAARSRCGTITSRKGTQRSPSDLKMNVTACTTALWCARATRRAALS